MCCQSLDVAYELKQQQHLVGLIHEVDCLPSYFITGGLVFAPLSWPLLEVRGLVCVVCCWLFVGALLAGHGGAGQRRGGEGRGGRAVLGGCVGWQGWCVHYFLMAAAAGGL